MDLESTGAPQKDNLLSKWTSSVESKRVLWRVLGWSPTMTSSKPTWNVADILRRFDSSEDIEFKSLFEKFASDFNLYHFHVLTSHSTIVVCCSTKCVSGVPRCELQLTPDGPNSVEIALCSYWLSESGLPVRSVEVTKTPIVNAHDVFSRYFSVLEQVCSTGFKSVKMSFQED